MVFEQFLAVLVAIQYYTLFQIFWGFLPAKPANSQTMDYQNLKNRQTTILMVFWRFLGGFWADFGGFGSYMVLFIISILMKPPKTAQKPPKTTQKLSKNRQNSGLEVFEILKIHDLWIGQFGR